MNPASETAGQQASASPSVPLSPSTADHDRVSEPSPQDYAHQLVYRIRNECGYTRWPSPNEVAPVRPFPGRDSAAPAPGGNGAGQDPVASRASPAISRGQSSLAQQERQASRPRPLERDGGVQGNPKRRDHRRPGRGATGEGGGHRFRRVGAHGEDGGDAGRGGRLAGGANAYLPSQPRRFSYKS